MGVGVGEIDFLKTSEKQLRNGPGIGKREKFDTGNGPEMGNKTIFNKGNESIIGMIRYNKHHFQQETGKTQEIQSQEIGHTI